MYTDATIEEIDAVMKKSWEAFHQYRKFPLKQRADFMRAIAVEMESLGDELVKIASSETNLPDLRLRNERARTIFQLNSYADACERGEWMELRIDTAIPDRNPPKTDLRKMMVPLGPVVVFGASNFPFAYSTAGGDTACALAAGCPVIVKAHPAHAETSEQVAAAILKAAKRMNMPEGIFAHVHGAGFEVGKSLVTHPLTKAVGFTGSFSGGKALFDLASQRKEPIPVFAEMSSVNPVFLLPEKLKQSSEEIARLYAGSITLGVGQFCTNPGLIFGMDGKDLDQFISILGAEIKKTTPGTMLHPGISKAYTERRKTAITQATVETIAVSEAAPKENQAPATVASASAQAFLNNPVLHQEVFGPYSIVIRCKDMNEMITAVKHVEGQLTSTLMATETDIRNNETFVEEVKNICGRFILNGVPTGVEVCLSMQHGGPFPATTDSRFTSVGADGIKRFARPLCFQNWTNALLPAELKNENPLALWRTVNDRLTKEIVS
jgi:NADP-dependent aldehyde dehydrogenase